jgi:hypothetical protein
MRAGPLYIMHNGLEEWLPDVAIGHPLFAAIEDDRAVAVCTTVIASQDGHEASVETLAAYRGRGSATDVVAGGHARCGNWLPRHSTPRLLITFRPGGSPSDSVCRRSRLNSQSTVS